MSKITVTVEMDIEDGNGVQAGKLAGALKLLAAAASGTEYRTIREIWTADAEVGTLGVRTQNDHPGPAEGSGIAKA